MKVDTEKLKGPALAWAVAQIEGQEVVVQGGQVYLPDHDDELTSLQPYDPANDPAQGQPIIEREFITVVYYGEGGEEGCPWEGYQSNSEGWIDMCAGDGIGGGTALEAAMKAYVCIKLGYAAEVPDELVAA